MMNFKMTSALALILWTARAVAVPASLQARSQQSCDNACAGNEMQDPWHQAQCCRDLVDYCAEQMSTQDLEMTRWKQAGFDQCDTVYLKKTPKDCRDELLSVDEVLAIDLTSSSTACELNHPERHNYFFLHFQIDRLNSGIHSKNVCSVRIHSSVRYGR